MPFNGAGAFVRLRSWVADKAALIKIRADYHDSEDDGFADGLSNTICRDGQSTIIADIPFNGKKIIGLGAATAGGDALNRDAGDGRYAQLAANNNLTGTDNHFTGQSTGPYSRVSMGGFGNPTFQAHGLTGSNAAAGFSIQAASDGFAAMNLVGTGIIGSITGNGAGGTAFNTSSDGRIKTNLEAITGALASVMRLKPYRGHYKGFEDRHKSTMFVAHELQEVLPDLVMGEKDATIVVETHDDDGNVTGSRTVIVPQQVDYSKAVVILTAALQELVQLNEVLTQRVEVLEGA